MSLLRRGPQPHKPSRAELIQLVSDQLRAELALAEDWSVDDQRADLLRRADRLFGAVGLSVSEAERARLLRPILLEQFGLSAAGNAIPDPLAALFADDTIDEIQINGPQQVLIRQGGQVRPADWTFASEAELLTLLRVLLGELPSSPLIDERLPGGLMVTAALRPVTPNGPVITIRRHLNQPPTLDELIRTGVLSPEAAEFLIACVRGRINLVISGGQRSGAEKLLDVLSGFIPAEERVSVIERQPLLQFQHPQRFSLLTVPDAVSAADLIRHSQYLGVDRLVLGEACAGETWDFLQTRRVALLTSLYAFSARGAIDRLEAMAQMSGEDIPLLVIRRQIAQMVQVIVHLDCLNDSSRHVQAITEVQGMSGDMIILADLFRFEQTGREAGKIVGGLRSTGLRPMLMVALEDAGITLSPSIFGLRKRGDG